MDGLDIAGGGHDLTVGVIFQRIGGEADFLVIVGHRRVGRADRRLGLVQLGLGRLLRMGQRRREQAGRGSAGKQRLFERQGKHGNLQA